MNEIGAERLQATAQNAQALGNKGAQERRSRLRRAPAAAFANPNAGPGDQAEATAHDVDSRA